MSTIGAETNNKQLHFETASILKNNPPNGIEQISSKEKKSIKKLLPLDLKEIHTRGRN